jgi:hypothetical protein
MKFTEWFENRLIVGAYPYMNNIYFNAKEFDLSINVSDEFYDNFDKQIIENGCKSFWFPMNECKKDNGVNSIYGAMVILFNAEKEGKKVYLHCHAGIHRSQLVRCCYYFLRTGKQLDNNWSSFVNQLLADCARGYLPPKNEMEDFLNNLGKRLESFNGRPMGGLLDTCKIETLRNF